MSEIATASTGLPWSSRDIEWLPGRGRLAQAIELEERAPRGLAVWTIVAVVLTLVSLVAWAAVTPIGEVASASGEISPIGTVRRIQHLEGGIVAAIHVREGDAVAAGQPLIDLDSGAALPELAQLRARLAALGFQQAQLAAFRIGSDPGAAADRSTPASAVATAQGDLLAIKRQAIQSQEAVLREQIEQRMAERRSLTAQIEKIREQLLLVDEQVATRAGLVEKGLTPRMVLLDLQRDQARVRTVLVEIEGQVSRTDRAILEAEAKLPELRARSARETAEEFAKLEADSAEVRESIARAEDRVKRLVIRSPVAGTVKGLQTETLGGVITPGSVVLEVIPSDVPLLVEARLQTKDIGFVHVGQGVDVKVAAYDYTRFGSIQGKVQTISATTFTDDKGNAFYKARIALDASHVGNQPGRNAILPGMTVIADIRTGEKSLLGYLLKPLVHATNEAFRER